MCRRRQRNERSWGAHTRPCRHRTTLRRNTTPVRCATEAKISREALWQALEQSDKKYWGENVQASIAHMGEQRNIALGRESSIKNVSDPRHLVKPSSCLQRGGGQSVTAAQIVKHTHRSPLRSTKLSGCVSSKLPNSACARSELIILHVVSKQDTEGVLLKNY